MTQVKRAERIGTLIQRELSDILSTKIKDPRLALVTITDVRLTNDLKSARIYYSVLEGDQRKQSVMDGFQSATGYLKRELGDRLDLRYTPDLSFVYDESFDRAASLNKVFEAIHNEDSNE